MKNKKKGFTIVETIVSLSIIAIVMSLVASLVVIVSNVSKKQQYDSQCVAEYQRASEVIDRFINNYSTTNFVLDSIETNSIKIKSSDSSSQYELTFNKVEQTLLVELLNFDTNEKEPQSLKFQNIKEINFVQRGKIISCSYIFENFNTYTRLVTFGA